MSHKMFSFDGISYRDFQAAVPSNKFLQSVKDVGKREDNSDLNFDWIRDFVQKD